MLKRKLFSAFALYILLVPTPAFGQAKIYVAPEADINKIKEQGLGDLKADFDGMAMRQAATIMAAFVYQTAMMDEKLPRKLMR